MPSFSRAGSDESAIAPIVHERVLRCREYGVAFGGDGVSDVVVSRDNGLGHDGTREGRAEDEVDHCTADLVNLVPRNRFYEATWASLRRAGDLVVDNLGSMGSEKFVGESGTPVKPQGSRFSSRVY